MELRSTGNSDTSNPVTMSMLEYLSSKGYETMATRNILHISKLQEFEDFLETKGYMIVATSKNPYEVLRAQKDGDTVIVYKKKDAREHLSTMDKDYHLVREFIKGQMKQSNADRIREMGDEELAKFIESLWCNNLGLCEVCPYMNRNYKNGMRKKKPNEMIIEWLKQPVED